MLFLYQQWSWWVGETGIVKIFRVGEMGVGEMRQIVGEKGVGEMGVGEMGVIQNLSRRDFVQRRDFVLVGKFTEGILSTL